METNVLENPELLNAALRDGGDREAVASLFLFTTIGRQVLELRTRRGLTQERLAELVGTKQPKISDIETAPRNANWELDTLLRLARALEVRLRVTFETFGSILVHRWEPPTGPTEDPGLLVTRSDAQAEELRLDLLDAEYRTEYAETATLTDLASQLRVLRRQRGLTQDSLRARCGVTQSALSLLENPLDSDNLPNCEMATLLRIGFALDVRPHVAFVSYATLIDDLRGVSSDSLRRPEPQFDPILHPMPSVMPAPDAEAPERTRWMQELMIPWLHQDDELAVGTLMRWLQGKGLPPVGHDEEPYRWILRGIPEGCRENRRYQRKLAERLAVVLSERPDEEPVVRGQDDEFLAGLYWTCAGLRDCGGVLGEPLWEAYKRLDATKLSGEVRDALQAAIIQNQYGDMPYKEIWRPMIQKGRHRWLRGSEAVGYEGLLVRNRNAISEEADLLIQALSTIVRRWSGDVNDLMALRRMISRTELSRNGLMRLRHEAETWPDWAAQAAFPKVELLRDGAEVKVEAHLYSGILEATWCPGKPAQFRFPDGNTAEVPSLRTPMLFYNQALTYLADLDEWMAHALWFQKRTLAQSI